MSSKKNEKVEKLSEIFPQAVEIPMLHGKKAFVSAFTLELVCWVEDQYGSMDEFQEVVFADKPNVKRLSEFLFQLIDNKSDYEDLADFRRHFPLPSLKKAEQAIIQVMGLSLISSVTTLDEKEGGEKAGK